MDAFLKGWRTMTEDQLAKQVMFKVEDTDHHLQGTFNRAEASVPMNLSLRLSSSRYNDSGVTGVWTKVQIPPGTRFGPIQGAICPPGKNFFFNSRAVGTCLRVGHNASYWI